MRNPDDDYSWYLAFTHAESFQTISKMLAKRGDLAGNVNEAFLCPDGQTHQVISVKYVVTQEVKGMTVEYKGSPLRYRVMRCKKPDGEIEWHRNRAKEGGENLADKITTGTAFLNKLQKKHSRVPDEEALKLPGGE